MLEPLHGYGVMQKVKRLSRGRVRLGPGTLYGALNNLQSAGLIVPVASPDEGGRRKTYAITDLGRRVVQAEIARLEAMVSHGKELLSSGGAADGRK